MALTKDQILRAELNSKLEALEQAGTPLPGIAKEQARKVFVEQLIESIHRVKYVGVVSKREISPKRADPTDGMFDPLLAAILHQRQSNFDEAFWLVFLFVHFGRNSKGRWRYAREVYGRLGAKPYWTWEEVSADPSAFRTWLHANQASLRRNPPPGGFGNHRKYESLKAWTPNGTGAVVESYVQWVGPSRSHVRLIQDAAEQANGDPNTTFDLLYSTMNVTRFGRTAKFDYLAMLGKLGLAAIRPGVGYISGSTGPAEGARLLFGGSKQAPLARGTLDVLATQLDQHLNIGMQAVEDAICNWQKSPDRFKGFRG